MPMRLSHSLPSKAALWKEDSQEGTKNKGWVGIYSITVLTHWYLGFDMEKKLNFLENRRDKRKSISRPLGLQS